jgi:hypothetical protein
MRSSVLVSALAAAIYTMSTWNPYQVIVMRSDLKLGAEAK